MEQQTLRYEYIVTAYHHGRYEIEVYRTAKDARLAIARHKGNLISAEMRLEPLRTPRTVTAPSSFIQIDNDLLFGMDNIERASNPNVQGQFVDCISG